jgi:hypothetical protein
MFLFRSVTVKASKKSTVIPEWLYRESILNSASKKADGFLLEPAPAWAGMTT